ncbi:hypothetical protein [Kordiimonas pumila]|uniref:Uncharacterized protein n=1 Tax=Kordiimonas pumila TaxID=2161677 RepID=A0ABV7D5M0_9PROT|nr:hypothetical protein [Kordiimonas pumila]
MSVDENFAALRKIYPEVQLMEQGGQKVAFIPNLMLKQSGQTVSLQALLWPYARDGYQTRLFLEKKVDGEAKNWKSFNLLGKSWWACSWRGVQANLPWPVILANHLRAL